jgi:hypothetical protein
LISGCAFGKRLSQVPTGSKSPSEKQPTDGKRSMFTFTKYGTETVESKARKRVLVITKTKEKNPKVKFSFSNGSMETYSEKEHAYFQCSRYWVERSFDDTKNELGLSGYQVRKWIVWCHHQSLVMMACVHLQQVKFENKKEYELMSVRDARILIIAHLFTNSDATEKLYK